MAQAGKGKLAQIETACGRPTSTEVAHFEPKSLAQIKPDKPFTNINLINNKFEEFSLLF
jgi:hypothetical protein